MLLCICSHSLAHALSLSFHFRWVRASNICLYRLVLCVREIDKGCQNDPNWEILKRENKVWKHLRAHWIDRKRTGQDRTGAKVEEERFWNVEAGTTIRNKKIWFFGFNELKLKLKSSTVYKFALIYIRLGKNKSKQYEKLCVCVWKNSRVYKHNGWKIWPTKRRYIRYFAVEWCGKHIDHHIEIYNN